MPSQFLPIRQCPHNACSWVHYAIGGLVITGCIYVCLHICMCVSQSMLNCHSTRVFDVCKRPKITFDLNKSNKYWSATWSSMFLVKTIIAINKTTILHKVSSEKLYVCNIYETRDIKRITSLKLFFKVKC